MQWGNRNYGWVDRKGSMKKNVAHIGVLIALGFILSYVEAMIPFHFAIPGVKLGLANLIVVVTLYLMDAKSAFVISLLRIVLVGFTFGNMNSLLYSLAGGIFSYIVMVCGKKMKGLSVLGVSVLGGVFHNVGQILVAIYVVQTVRLVYYLPVLLVSGVVTGVLIGIMAGILVERIKAYL